jgi:hypothetical protein
VEQGWRGGDESRTERGTALALKFVYELSQLSKVPISVVDSTSILDSDRDRRFELYPNGWRTPKYDTTS